MRIISLNLSISLPGNISNHINGAIQPTKFMGWPNETGPSKKAHKPFRGPHPRCVHPQNSWAGQIKLDLQKSPQIIPRPTPCTSSSINQPPIASRGGGGDQVVLSFYPARPCNFVDGIVVNLCELMSILLLLDGVFLLWFVNVVCDW